MGRDTLSGAEMRQLTRALVSAFERDGLDRLVSFYLNQDLAVIADAENLQDTAFELVRWSIRHGELTTLVEAAFVENPKNPMLVAFRAEIWEAPPATVVIPEAPRETPDRQTISGAVPVTPDSASSSAAAGSGQITRDDPWKMSRRIAIPVAAGLAGLGAAYLLLDRLRVNPPPPTPSVNGTGSQTTEEPTGAPVTQEPPPPAPTVIPSTGSVRFGNVPFPEITDRLIPDSQNGAWSDLGRRNVRGVVYHRSEGTLAGTDAYLRSVPPGGTEECSAGISDPSFGGCRGLVDFGVDADSGEVYRWNDPFGLAYPNPDDPTLSVSSNRSGWANGGIRDPYGEAEAFIAQNGNDAVNRDQASIQLSGSLDDAISDACKEAVAALSAYFADQYNIRWNEYPKIPGEDYGFVRWHNQFDSFTECPGPVVTEATNEIISRTRDILQQYQAI